MRKLTEAENTMLGLLIAPARMGAEAIKDEWRRRRSQSLEELGLPPLRRRIAEGDY